MQTIEEIINLAIEEDIGDGDHTSLSCIPSDATGKAKLLVKEEGILAGVDIAKRIFSIIDNSLEVNILIKDGTAIKPGDIALTVEGASLSILSAERLMLNCVQRMSGIATHTNKMCQLIAGYQCKILDTRKTTPNFRLFEKMAVKIGGGENHRFGLFDMIMIKDNHIDFAGGIKKAIQKTQSYLKVKGLDLKIEIEARNIQEVEEIIKYAGVDRIMLDNFSYSAIEKAVKLIDGKYETEASGGINEKTIREYAKRGVDFISVGALTHRINSLDLSLKAVS